MARVLIVDDEQMLREMLQQMLDIEGFETFTASNGSEALSVFKQCDPDVVVTDIIMPEKEGLEIIQILKGKKPNLKILAISGGSYNINVSDILKMAKALGANQALSKPIRRKEFIDTINNLLATDN